MKKLFFLLFSFFFFLFSFILSSCRKDILLTDSSAKLNFSEDTVIFDTVFTTIGSVTKQLIVYNPYNRSVKISSIRIAMGSASNFRMNVDGVPTRNATDIILRAKDSLYIFVEATVNPNSGATPMIITDSIVFETNGNFQDVDLAAWGQDANFYVNPVFCNYVWTNAKPHVIYGYAIVDSACTLTVDAGAKIYFHKNSGLIVYKDATLKVNGTLAQPVIFQGDRLEWSYHDVPGQWGIEYFGGQGIWLFQTSKNNIIDYAVIKNGNIGLQVDSTADNFTTPTVTINNTIIENMSGVALLGAGSKIEANNSIFANAGQYSAALVYGGDYLFRQCTFANYWKYGKRDTPLLLLNNYYDSNGSTILRALKNADFQNCIIYGVNANEITLDQNSGAAFEYKFDYCLLKTDINTSDAARFISIILNPAAVTVDNQPHDPVFTDASENDFHLFSQSVAIDKANPTYNTGISVLTTDLDGKNRGSQPDLGAMEYVP